MIYREDERILFIRMDDGENFVENLEKVLQEAGVTSGVIISGVGMLRDLEIGWFNVEKMVYEKEQISVPHELVSISGNISLLEGNPFPHMHVSLAGPSRALSGGHLFSGIVCNTVELFILKAPLLELKRAASKGFKALE